MDRTGYEGLRIIAVRISNDTIINVFCDDSLKYNPYPIEGFSDVFFKQFKWYGKYFLPGEFSPSMVINRSEAE